jgi:asparagine synthase (glutamine-hydrolysing)
VIAHLYEALFASEGGKFVEKLDGDFAFVIYDEKTKSVFAARDPLGVCTMYYGFGVNGSFWVASEMKAIKDQCAEVHTFPPGHYYTEKTGFQPYFERKWLDGVIPETFTGPVDPSYGFLKQSFEDAVKKRMMCDVPMGVLLSGGLDSSLVASVASRFAAKRVEENFEKPAWFSSQLHTFSIGLEGAPDLPYAKKVADFLGTIHHEFHFTVQQGLDALRDVIWHLETFDVTTIRASTPMFLLSRKIKAMGIKMVLSGEGSDELMAGYLYFHLAPSRKEMQDEVISRVTNLHLADNLRANKSTMAFGLEARVPFLDKDFVDSCMSVDPEEKMHHDQDGKKRMEKYALRKAFDDKEHPYLPEDILWRQKEQFSDGCGYSWIDTLKSEAEARVSDEQLSRAKFIFPHLTPQTKEAYWFRTIFAELFPEPACEKTVMAWTPAWSKSKDPSGRAQTQHDATTEK